MIFHEHRAIYLHIGKTAGVSVERWLRDEDRDALSADRVSLFGYDRDEGIYLQHASAATVRRLVGDDVFGAYFVFTVVRNPYARMVSVYHYSYDAHQRSFGSFEGYVHRLPELASSEHNLRGSHHIPQVAYTHIGGQQVCDEIVRFEDLPMSLDPVAQRLGLCRSVPRKNLHRHPERNRPVDAFYTEETARIVRVTFAKDFEVFGYSTDVAEADSTEAEAR